jgi:hypothetical protein
VRTYLPSRRISIVRPTSRLHSSIASGIGVLPSTPVAPILRD